ncbi:hypothetical protein K439DRAFT_1663032 [Ramaria rubella]|nr:hypothetical protein K439DRAFT_1663032 [Ramaria rubella]
MLTFKLMSIPSAIRTLNARSVLIRWCWQALQRAFRDPESPFHLREGEVGPASPDELPRTSAPTRNFSTVASTFTSVESDFTEAAAEAHAHALSQGHDPDSFFEEKVVWGDLDSFHPYLSTYMVSHMPDTLITRDMVSLPFIAVPYECLRFLESSRMNWVSCLAHEAGGPTAAADMVSGRGIGLILKSISVDFKRPVVYPDTLLISHRPRRADPPSPTHFNNNALIYSYAQRAVVATSESVLVWYDYDKLQKSPPPEPVRKALERRMTQTGGEV